MGIRVVAGFACVLGVWAGPVLGDEGAGRAASVQLASIAPLMGQHVLEQRSQGASVRIPERVIPPALVAPRPRDEATRPASVQPGRIRKSNSSRVNSRVRKADPVPAEAVGAGYQRYFGSAVPHLAEPPSLAAPRSSPRADKAALWTVFGGTVRGEPDPKPGRNGDLERPPELLLAVKAGF